MAGHPRTAADYFKLQKRLALVTRASLVSAGILAFTVILRPDPAYFFAGADCPASPAASVLKPVISDEDVTRFAMTSAMQIFVFDHANWSTQFKEIAKNFTYGGFESFKAEVEAKGILKSVQENRLAVTGVVRGPPNIFGKPIMNGVESWAVSMPMAIKFQAANDIKTQNVAVEMTIIRVPIEKFGQPLLIDSAKAMSVSVVD